MIRFLLACVATISGVAAAETRQQDAAAARIDAMFVEWNRLDSAGCGVGVSRNGELAFERGYGMANVESKVAITPATVFHVASISKQFTAMSILLLAQRGRLALDDEVRKHIPDWADQGNHLKIRHLLSHTGGLRDGFLLLQLIPPGDEKADVNEAVVRIVARQRGLNFAPGTEFQYSNSGYVVLANSAFGSNLTTTCARSDMEAATLDTRRTCVAIPIVDSRWRSSATWRMSVHVSVSAHAA